MAIAVFSKHVAHLLIIGLLIAVCSAHSSSKSGKGKGGSGGRRPGRGNLPGITRCYLAGAYPCYSYGLRVSCFYPSQICDGIRHCPYGDDEYLCSGTGIRPTTTIFRTRTVSRTTTSTSTTTTSTTSSTSTTTTTTSTISSMMTSTHSLAAVVPYSAASSTLTTIFTTTTTYLGLQQIGAGNAIAQNVIFCDNLVMIGNNVVAVAGRVSAQVIAPSITITASASISCPTGPTTYTTI